MFLHKCCFLTEDDMSIASFERPCSSLSRASLAGYELQTMLDKEIIYIKRSPKVWYDIEDETPPCFESDELTRSSSSKTETCSKGRSSKSSTKGKHVMRKFNSLNINNKNRNKGKNKLLFLDPQKSSSYIFPSKNRVYSSTTRILDWLMNCCWRCSPGCQQLPTINM